LSLPSKLIVCLGAILFFGCQACGCTSSQGSSLAQARQSFELQLQRSCVAVAVEPQADPHSWTLSTVESGALSLDDAGHGTLTGVRVVSLFNGGVLNFQLSCLANTAADRTELELHCEARNQKTDALIQHQGFILDITHDGEAVSLQGSIERWEDLVDDNDHAFRMRCDSSGTATPMSL